MAVRAGDARHAGRHRVGLTSSVPVADATLARRIRALFDEAGFRTERVQEVLGTSEHLVARSTERPVYERRLGDDLLSTLIRLFVLGLRPRRDALPDEQLATLLASGLVHEKGEKLAGAVRVIPHEHLLIASDFAGGQDLQHVAAVHRPSHTLARLTVRRPVERALDIGTGNGVQALLAARHASTVVATDVNSRALEFARFNAALNGVDNVELRHGSYLAPVEGERFGLVVANPPYVISPETRYLFRDSGLPGDTVSEQLARSLPSVLEDGGFATLMISWADAGEDPVARPRSWFEGSGCDVYLIHTRTEDTLTTAATWNRDLASDADEYAAAIDEWVAYFDRERITAVAYGAIVLRRRDGARNWFHATALPQRGFGNADGFLRRVFSGLDALADGALDEQTARVAEDVRLQQVLRLDGAWVTDRVVLTVEDGLPFEADLDENTAAIVRRLDGRAPLRDVLSAAARELGVDEAAFREAGLQLVRELVAAGFVSV